MEETKGAGLNLSESLRIDQSSSRSTVQRDIGDEELVIAVMKDALFKTKLVLATFDADKRLIPIQTYIKEIFDLLWKLCTRIQPIVSFLVREEDAFVLCGQAALAKRVIALKVLNCSDPIPERKVLLTPDIVLRVQQHPDYKTIVTNLVEQYQTIVNFLLGCAEVVDTMKNYHSLWNLFKYSLALAYEADAWDASKKGLEGASTLYLQSLFVNELILSDIYTKHQGKQHLKDKLYNDYYFIDTTNDHIIVGEHTLSRENNIDNLVKVRMMADQELEYAIKARNELRMKYQLLKDAKAQH